MINARFKSKAAAAIVQPGIEPIRMMRKQQARNAHNPSPFIVAQFIILAADSRKLLRSFAPIVEICDGVKTH